MTPITALTTAKVDIEIMDEDSVLLADVIRKKGQKFHYTYDFGDDWDHLVEVEKVLPVDDQQPYPQCIAGARACPPEDVGRKLGLRRVPGGHRRSSPPRT